MPEFGGIKDRVAGVFRGARYENFQMPKQGYEQMDSRDGVIGGGGGGGGGVGGGGYADDGADSPMSFDDFERPPLRHIDKYIKAECPCFSARFTIAIMTCIGFIISFGMRCNMSMAKLEFLANAAAFNWSASMESAVDSSFFYGYLITQIPGGFLTSKYAANYIFGTAVACSSVLNMFLPGAVVLDPIAICVVKLIQGLLEGVTYPACHGIWRFWAPPLERSRLATIAFSGSYAGVVIGIPLSGLLTAWIGWQAVFYFYGIFGIIWYVFWLWLTFEKPRLHPAITIQELKYIEKSLGASNPAPSMPSLATTPWRDFFTSMPVYAIIVANFCRSWNFYLLVLYQSKYLKSYFKFEIEKTGLLGALPHLLMTIIVPFGGMLADYLRKSGIMTTTNVRKLFNCGGFGLEGVFFLVVANATKATTAITALTIGVACSGFAISGYNVNHLDIAPRYASILMGLSNGIGTIAGIICPVVIDYMTHNQENNKDCWSHVFLMAAIVHLCGITFYAIFASGELQSWAEPVVEEQVVWSPTTAGYAKETSFNEKPQQPITQTKTVTYGAVEHVAGNPFAYAATIAEEPVQPEAKDTYLHGGVDDRTY